MKNKIVNLILPPPFWNKMPPLGLAMLDSFLKEQVDVKVYDLNIDFFSKAPLEYQKIWISSFEKDTIALDDFIIKFFGNEIKDFLEKVFNPKAQNYYCFSFYYSNKNIAFYMAKLLRKIDTKAIIVFGGPEIIYYYKKNSLDFLYDYADVLVVGDGELALQELVNGADKKLYVHYQTKESPCTSFEKFNLSAYTRKGFLPLLFGKGCVNKCEFCVERLLHKGYSLRGSKKVVEEIENYIAKYGVKNFIFHDSLINADLRALEEFCDIVIEKSLPIKWEAQVYIRSDMSLRLLEKMKKAGCYNMFIGLENFSDKVLMYFKKGYVQKDATQFFEKAKMAGLHFEVSLIFGSIVEDEEAFNENIDAIKKYKNLIPKIAQINELKKLPGTHLEYIDSQITQNRIKIFLDVLDKEGVRYTREFINNFV